RFDRPVIVGILAVAGALAPRQAAAQDRISLATPPPGNEECVPVSAPDPVRLPVRGARLTMAPQSYRIGGKQFTTNVYNRHFLGPTLTMQPGETMNLSVVNAMRETDSQPAAVTAWTNLHYHGLVVTPRPDGGDNVTHVHIDRDAPPRGYDFPVPAYHTTGMFWYHPHPHGISTPQVGGGLSGALLVGSILQYFPQYAGVRERVLLIRDMGGLVGSPALLNLNGSTCARLAVAPGERQLWHIGNFGANNFVNLKLDGMRWTLLAMDGNPLPVEEQVDSLWIPPGSRAEVIVTGPPAGTRVRLFSAPFAPRTTASTTLGWLVGEGRARAPLAARALRGADASVIDTLLFLRKAREVGRHTFRFQFIGDSAGVNDSIYKPTDLPVAIPWRQVQEWTIINETKSLHTFHIHQTDFVVTSVNGQPVDERLLRDNVPVGVHPDGRGGFAGDTITLRFTFEPIAAGPFVFHCHVLAHEDEGMMHNVCVYDPNDPDGVNKCNAMFSGGGAHGH
ncbi:MAG TPA: multicopper oxidase family protein, partial [Longimicrobium sp.]|nr:multicopper oxidase family protein [Longimicrobium sp.]